MRHTSAFADLITYGITSRHERMTWRLYATAVLLAAPDIDKVSEVADHGLP